MDNAFPTLESNWNNDANGLRYELVGGLTKRELFAAMALQGIHASMAEGHSCSDQVSAAIAVELADMLIAELAR